jgi:hypothetical protein
MSETDSAAITSSADRMVGMDHAEVRYFTRYVLDTLTFIYCSWANHNYSYDHHGERLCKLPVCYSNG